MPAYVPPAMRGKAAAESSEPAAKSDRFDSLKGEGQQSSKNGKDGKGYGKGSGGYSGSRDDGDKKTSAFSASGEGGDWKRRQDGRNPSRNVQTELEVFGEKKTRSTAGVDFDKYDAIPVQISGNDTENIKPVQRFSEAKLTESLFDNLRRCGYERPTPVQQHSIPIVTSGRDLMACAQTGSGKTCAFMVPCIESLLRSGPPENPMGASRRSKPMPCGLCLAPTRELAAQIHVESLKFAFDTGIRCCIIYGGADMQEQRRDLEQGCDILIATPGRLSDMCERNNISLELVQFFILDEADRMLDMGFEPQVRAIVENTGMGRNSKFPRQNMMFSATFAREVQAMAADFMNDYVFITVGRVGSASELISQQVVYAGELKGKTRALERAIKEHLPKDGLAVVFVQTKRSADSLELELHEAGVSVACIHGDRSQQERESALEAFKTGSNPVLVATDVAARGLDIPNVALVVNFDMPTQLDDYVHRIGRTGRAGRKGVAIAFVNERCTYLPELGDLLVEAKQDPPEWFRDLCRSSARRAPGKGGGRANKFGGQDLRMEEGAGGLASAAPTNNWTDKSKVNGGRGPNAFGVSGQDDSW
eukprot:TRINITY_DN517_c0_g2_i1.p1 TRINITY_DN517_c0_g2~~TRINITY_DN517_c0_g2_i1.p1  ORF type:complete len:591 (+),score=119.27 TRINITY_DN517_c0_g2_i1:54-1826(+)